MKSLQILPGMRVIDVNGDPCRGVDESEWANSGPWQFDVTGGGADYSDPATCGAIMAWCHRELEQAIAQTHKPLRPRFNVARVALSEARPWNGDSVRRAVEAVCEVLP